MKKIYMHYDMDAFFASVEQRENPELRGIPIAVGHGIVTTASYEARKFGVKSAMPVAAAKKLCPHLKLVPVRKNYYGKVGREIQQLILKITDKCEFASIDEGYIEITEFVKTPVNVQADQLLTIERGTTGSKLAALFEQEKLIDDGKLLPYLLKLKPELNKIKAGTYSLENVKIVQDLLDLLNSGKEVQFNVKWIEGKTFKDWRKDLENAPHLVQTLKDKSNEDIFALLDLPDVGQNLELKNVEGWLYPDTYNYTPKSTDLELLKRSAERMKKALNKAWNERDEDLPLANPYEMLILASIVEKETGVATERAKVASVFLNRLKAKMKLQTDPTVIYGMGENYSGNIRKKDLEMSTPYNTYVIDGLPPTPIAMPSESSLHAVANPEKTDFYYFVANGSGGHKFTRNLNEHNKAVQEYLRWYRSQKNAK